MVKVVTRPDPNYRRRPWKWMLLDMDHMVDKGNEPSREAARQAGMQARTEYLKRIGKSKIDKPRQTTNRPGFLDVRKRKRSRLAASL